MRPTRCFTCWACTAIVAVCLLQAAVYMGVFKTSHARLISRTESGSVIESLSLSLTYSRWWGRPDVKAWDPPRPAKPSIPPDEANRLKNRCSQAVDIPKVALLFLTKGDLPHKDMWIMWLRSAAGQLPTNVRYNSFLQHDTSNHAVGLRSTTIEAHNASVVEDQGSPAKDQGSTANASTAEAVVEVTSNQGPIEDGTQSAPQTDDAAAANASRGRSLLGTRGVAHRRRLLEEDTPPPPPLTVDDGVELMSNEALQQLTETVAMCQVCVLCGGPKPLGLQTAHAPQGIIWVVGYCLCKQH